MQQSHAIEKRLSQLLLRIDTTAAVSPDLVRDVLAIASPRSDAARAVGRADRARALSEAGAFVELALLLVERELPDFAIHRLSRDEARWICTICVQGLAMNWVDDVVEYEHEELALAIYGALVQAQLRKLRGLAPSNVTPFRAAEPDRARTGRL